MYLRVMTCEQSQRWVSMPSIEQGRQKSSQAVVYFRLVTVFVSVTGRQTVWPPLAGQPAGQESQPPSEARRAVTRPSSPHKAVRVIPWRIIRTNSFRLGIV
jgi:hypothetical protein